MSLRGPGQGIFSGWFRSSKFTQSSCLSCHEKSLRPELEWWGKGGDTCKLQAVGGASPSILLLHVSGAIDQLLKKRLPR